MNRSIRSHPHLNPASLAFLPLRRICQDFPCFVLGHPSKDLGPEVAQFQSAFCDSDLMFPKDIFHVITTQFSLCLLLHSIPQCLHRYHFDRPSFPRSWAGPLHTGHPTSNPPECQLSAFPLLATDLVESIENLRENPSVSLFYLNPLFLARNIPEVEVKILPWAELIKSLNFRYFHLASAIQSYLELLPAAWTDPVSHAPIIRFYLNDPFHALPQ